MKREIFVLLTVLSYSPMLIARPVDQHIRGKIESVNSGRLVIRTPNDSLVSVALSPGTHYLQVLRSDLAKVKLGSYIGTATKETGSMQVALVIMIFPAAMRGLNAGHFPYDRLPDTTLSGGATTPSMMTNGSVAVMAKPNGASVNTTMTNGNVSGSVSQSGLKELTITYKNGRQTVVVPPTTPIVELRPETLSDVSEGSFVFVDATRDGKSLTANLVAAGAAGLRPPF
jgi:hypothetical protein